MTGNEVRKKFLEFFASKGHAIIESDSLVPKNDKTVLFTTAGMQQFKRQFLGVVEDTTRAVTSQKCLRTDDLDEVGKTNFHHTFFEMLGNFSFGDYFKKEAIVWAWEFFTEVLKIPEDKLWVSIYKDDLEAKDIWLKEIGVPAKRLIKLGDKSNFWPAEAKKKGPNGPCGPCSEIFYDYGVNKNCKNKKCSPDCDCGRFSEIWNLVFTQFNRKEGGKLEPLPNKNIDTGMGLERLVAVIQDKKNNFETDLFKPIMQKINGTIASDCKVISLTEKRIIADHIRAICFGIADGVIPSNEGRGYVIKKLIIDTTDIALKTGVLKPIIYTLVASVAQAMKDPYPDIKNKIDDIAGIIENVEKAYISVRKERLPELEEDVNKYKSDPKNLGKIIFKYRDTYGLTIPTINNVINTAKVSLSVQKKANHLFEKLMKHQQKQSRASSKMTGDVFTGTDLDLNVPKTDFTGYKRAEGLGTILKIYVGDKQINEINAGNQVKIILDRTPFYAEAGGQVGDTGSLSGKKGRIRINDTQKIDDIIIHVGEVEEGCIKINEQVTAKIDLERRMSIMRHHTATHILQAALRHVLGSHVKQQGSLVVEDRLRFDFTHHKQITQKEIERIEQYVNEQILRCDNVTKELLPIEKARESGALAFFEEKYGKVVRIVSIDEYSKEFCGGTHLDSTGQIGLFKITAETAIAQGIRRLEAKTGTFALEYVTQQEDQLKKLSQILKVPPLELVDRLNTQTKKLKLLEQQVGQFRLEAIKESIDTILTKAESVNGTKIVSHAFEDMNMELLRKVSDLLRQKTKSAIILLGAQSQDNASILLSVSEDLIKKGLKANDMIKEISPLINGSGGGRPQLAQAGSKEVSNIDQAIKQANKLIKKQIQK